MNRPTNRTHTASGVILLALGIIVTTPSQAWAYVDPGTGSYLFQLAMAAFLAGAYTMRRYCLAITTVFRGRFTAGGRSGRSVPRANEMD